MARGAEGSLAATPPLWRDFVTALCPEYGIIAVTEPNGRALRRAEVEIEDQPVLLSVAQIVQARR
jgi:hypothetical protein